MEARIAAISGGASAMGRHPSVFEGGLGVTRYDGGDKPSRFPCPYLYPFPNPCPCPCPRPRPCPFPCPRPRPYPQPVDLAVRRSSRPPVTRPPSRLLSR